MEIRRLTIILKNEKGNTIFVKLNGCFDGISLVDIEIKSNALLSDGTLYFVGDKTTKTDVNMQKCDYKIAICVKEQLICIYDNSIDFYIGSNLKTPTFAQCKKLVDDFKKAQLESQNATKIDNKNITKKVSQNEDIFDKNCVSNIKKISGDNCTFDDEGNACKKGQNCNEIFTENCSNFCIDNQIKNDDKIIDNNAHQINKNLNDKNDEKECQTIDENGCFDKDTGSDIQSFVSKLNQEMQNEKDKYDGKQATQIFDFDENIRYDGSNFYLAIKPQLDEMFVCYPPETQLNEIVPNSKWVRIVADGEVYVVGLVYDVNVVSFICYGIPFEKYTLPPTEIADVAVWLPVDLKNKDGRGYYVIYQSAIDGKCVR